MFVLKKIYCSGSFLYSITPVCGTSDCVNPLNNCTVTACQTQEERGNREHFLHWDHCCRSCVTQCQRIVYLSACYYCTTVSHFLASGAQSSTNRQLRKEATKSKNNKQNWTQKHQELHKVTDLVNFLLFFLFGFWGCGSYIFRNTLKNEFRKPTTSDNINIWVWETLDELISECQIRLAPEL